MEVIADMYIHMYFVPSFIEDLQAFFSCALVAPKPLAASDLQCLDVFDKTENTSTQIPRYSDTNNA